MRALVFSFLIVASVCPVLGQRHKLQVSDPAIAQQLSANGAKLIADYGSFKLYEVDEMAGGERTEARDDYNLIKLNTGDLDTRTPAIISRRQAVGAFAGKHTHLVQFAGPVKTEWYRALIKTGVRVVTYIPNNTYLVHGDARALGQLQTWAASVDYVQWEGPYADDYKIHPRARPLPANAKPVDPIDQTDLMSIQLLADDDDNPVTLQLIDQLKLAPVDRHDSFQQYVNVIVQIPRNQLAQLATRPDVVSIQPYVTPQMFDERQDQIVAGNLTGSVPSGPGYLAWLAGKGFTLAQFTASDFAVDLTDSGVDNGTNKPNHFGLYVSGDTNLASRIIYNHPEGTGTTNDLPSCEGHGNINAHIIAGYDDLSGFPFADASGFHYGLGVCPFTRVGSSVIFNAAGSFLSPDYEDLQSRAYRDKARLSSNSWGANTAGAYNSDSQRYDFLVRDAQPTLSAVPNAGN